MMPYNFDISGFSAPGGYPGGELHPGLPFGHEQTAALHQHGALGAETNTVVSNVTGAPAVAHTPGLSAYATVGKSRNQTHMILDCKFYCHKNPTYEVAKHVQ